MQVVMLLYPRLTQLDLTGPYEVLARFEELTLHLVWKNLDASPIRAACGCCPRALSLIAHRRTFFSSPADRGKSRSWKIKRFSPFCAGRRAAPAT